ncbi:MAG: exodeoxyribonuclease III [Rickettsiales bacterium]|nr:exodeoxyribonuclease III [Rickettsiales bacterium]
MISIATWNVNSIKVRVPHLLQWLRAESPDIVLLQELKCIDDAFPCTEIEELGYNIATHGQKTYNGVAILSKFRLSDIHRGLAGDDADLQARYIEAVAEIPSGVIRVASVYVPNGQTADSDKFQYKLAFLERLKTHLKNLLTYDEAMVIGGDYNIAPEDIDVHDPIQWHGSVLTHDLVRTSWRRMIHLGLHDAYRAIQPKDGGYSWWDYRAGAYHRDDGLRIDHLLLSTKALEKLRDCRVHKELRALEKPSDHTPVIGVFDL